MKFSVRSAAAMTAVVLSYAYLFLFPREASEAVADGLRLCATVVLPSLFPYIVLTNCIVSSGIIEKALRRFQSSVAVSALILGLLGGYPLGAKALQASVRENRVSLRRAAMLLPHCNNAGAALFLSMIGAKLFGSLLIGAKLYAIHILSALLFIRLIPAEISEPKRAAQKYTETSFRFTASVRDAAETALNVSALIVVFSVIVAAAKHAAIGQPFLSLILSGTLELSCGCSAAAFSTYSLPLRAALCALFAGWGGLCVHAQTAALFASGLPHYSRYLAVKALHGVISFLLTLLVFQAQPPFFLLAFAILFLPFQKIRLEKRARMRYNRKKLRRIGLCCFGKKWNATARTASLREKLTMTQ